MPASVRKRCIIRLAETLLDLAIGFTRMKPALDLTAQPCPCGSGLGYALCCGRCHQAWREQDGRPIMAPDALALMRSRYSAYVLDQVDYLLATWHPDHRPKDVAPNEAGLQWLGLSIRAHVRLDIDHEEVEFVARSKLHGRAHRLHERSSFVRVNEQWLYTCGVQL